MLPLFCEKCVAESHQENYESQTSSSQGQVPKFPFPTESGTTPENSRVWFTSSEERVEPFNKSVFVIPITGILLVITMVFLVRIYNICVLNGSVNFCILHPVYFLHLEFVCE